MARFRRALALRPVTSHKHYVLWGPTNNNANSITTSGIVSAVADPARGTSAAQVAVGSHVKNIWVEMWINGANSSPTTSANFTFAVYKLPSGTANPTTTNMGSPHTWDDKKNVFFFTRGLAPNDTSTGPIPVHRGWIKIPRGKSRMGLGDKIAMSIYNSVGLLQSCGFALFKEYS